MPLGHEVRTAATILTHTRPDLPARLHSLTPAAFQLLRPTSCSDAATQQPAACILQLPRAFQISPCSNSTRCHLRTSVQVCRLAPPVETETPGDRRASQPAATLHIPDCTRTIPPLRTCIASSVARLHPSRPITPVASAAHRPTSLNNTRPPTLSSKEVLEQFSWLY